LFAAAAAGALVAGLLGWAAALGGPRWRTFGRAWGTGESPFVVSSAWTRNPNRLRFRVLDSKNLKVSISWSLNCENANNYGSRSGNINRKPPFTKTFTRFPVRNPTRCDLYVNGSQAGFSSSLHRLTVILQKR
jgi:hypothetical protein